MKYLSYLSILSVLFLSSFFSNLFSQDTQTDKIYKAWLKSNSRSNAYPLVGYLHELKDSSIIFSPNNRPQVELRIETIKKLQFLQKGKIRRIFTVPLGSAAGFYAAHLLSQNPKCTSNVGFQCYGEVFGKKILALGGGIFVGAIIGELVGKSGIKIKLNGSQERYQKSRTYLEKFIH